MRYYIFKIPTTAVSPRKVAKEIMP